MDDQLVAIYVLVAPPRGANLNYELSKEKHSEKSSPWFQSNSCQTLTCDIKASVGPENTCELHLPAGELHGAALGNDHVRGGVFRDEIRRNHHVQIAELEREGGKIALFCNEN